MKTKQTKFQDFTRIFEGSGNAAPPAPAQPQFVVVQTPPVAAQPQMVQIPASIMEDYQRRANEAADLARKEEARKAAALMAPVNGVQQQPVSEAQEAKTMREQISNLTKIVEMEATARRAAELNATREKVLGEYRAMGLDPAFDIHVSGSNEMELRQKAANALNAQSQMAQRLVQGLVHQYGASVQHMQQLPMQPQSGVPVGYVTQPPQMPYISAPSMISAPAPVPQGAITMEQINALTSHEAMMNGTYGANRGALMNGLRQGQAQPSMTQYQPTPAPVQFQPQGHQPMTAFNAPQSQFVPQRVQPQFQPHMMQQPGIDPLQAAIAATERLRANPGAVQSLVNQGFLV